MLATQNRLRQKKDIDRAFKSGRSLREGTFLMKALKNHLPDSRIGFIVSQKVAKKAVSRNRIKRRLRAIVGKNLECLQKGVDLLFVALPGSEKKNFASTKADIDKLLAETGYLNK